MATVVLTLVAGFMAGVHGAMSATLGGLVTTVSGIAAAVVASLGRAGSAGGVIVGAIAAETVKVGLIVILLWLVLATYRDVVVLAFIGSFLVTVLIFSMAFFVREY